MNAFFAHHTLLHDITEGMDARAHTLDAAHPSALLVIVGAAAVVVIGALLG